MKLQRTTLILILLALALGGFVYFHEIRGQQEEVNNKKQQIFAFAAEDVQSLTIKTKNNTINLERNSNGNTKWLLKSPEVAPAKDAVVSYLIDLLVKGKAERTLSVSANQLSEFGLDQPQATIDVKLKNQKRHQMILGKSDFNRRFMYAQINILATKSNTDVLLVSTDFGNAVNRELSEWKIVADDTKQPSGLPSIGKPIPLSK